jgi:hypothetical protein
MKYELIIKEIDSGEVVCHKKCDCVLGAVAATNGDEVTAGAISFVNAPVYTILGGLAAATDTIVNLKQHLYEDFNKTLGVELSKKEFDEFIDALANKGVTEECTFEVVNEVQPNV